MKSADNNQVVLITGASRGIGYALADAFLSHGHNVIVSAKHKQPLTDAVKKLKEKHASRIDAFAMDLNDEKSIEQFFISVAGLNYQSLVLVNNAGIGHLSPIEEITEQDVREVFNTNFFGHLRLIKLFFQMLKNNGTIINIFSTLSIRPIENWALYASAKSAFSTFSIGMQMEYAHHGINVLNIFPGKINTLFTSRSLGSDEIKNASSKGGICPSQLAKKIYKMYDNKKKGQLFYPGSIRILLLLHALSIDMTSKLLNCLLARKKSI